MFKEKIKHYIDVAILTIGLFFVSFIVVSRNSLRILSETKRRRAISRFKFYAKSKASPPRETSKDVYGDWPRSTGLNSVLVSTSGSTGKPFSMVRSRISRKMEQIYMLRVFWLKGYRPWMPIGWIRSYVPAKGQLPVLYVESKNHWMFSAYDLSDKNIEEYLEIILSNKIEYCFSYPSALYVVAKFLEDNERYFKGVKAFICSSEMLYPEWKVLIEQRFLDCEVIDVYNNVEATALLTSCNTCGGYHMNSDYARVDFIESGVEGVKKIIGTGFLNDKFPLVNYDAGDYMEISGFVEPVCGRKDPVVVGKIVGRDSDMIHLVKKDIPMVNLFTVMYHFAHCVNQFQFVQHSKEKIELKVVGGLSNEEELLLLEELRLRFEEETEIFVSLVEIIERDRVTGKVYPLIKKYAA